MYQGGERKGKEKEGEVEIEREREENTSRIMENFHSHSFDNQREKS